MKVLLSHSATLPPPRRLISADSGSDRGLLRDCRSHDCESDQVIRWPFMHLGQQMATEEV